MRSLSKSTVVFWAVVKSVVSVFAQASLSPIIDLGTVKYRGYYNDTLGINEFRGIRFAEPPLQDLRWKAPQPYLVRNVTGPPLDATKPASPCVQGYPQWTISGDTRPFGSEDCLFLDVYVPASATEHSKLPVAVSIPGGGYTMGYADQSSPYALLNHSRNSFIFVNIQYRLGAYGFLGSEEYIRQGGEANIGLLDQRLALKWVQDYIKDFGGDSSKVTVLGGSAGGGSVTSHLIWKGGVEAPPFRAAMADFPWWQQYLKEEQLAVQYRNLLDSADCPNIVCLQRLTEEQLMVATQATYNRTYKAGAYGYGNFYYGPYLDGKVIRDLPSREFREGHFAKVPTWTTREGYEGFTFSNQSMASLDEELADLRVQFPSATMGFFNNLLALYPQQEFNSTFWQRATWFGDFSINCPTRYVASSLAANEVPVYKQIINIGTQIHGAIGPYLSDLDYASEPEANITLAYILRDWWVSFVIHNDPNAQSWSEVTKPFWPGYGSSGDVMSINFTELGAVSDRYFDNTRRCSFFWENDGVIRN